MFFFFSALFYSCFSATDNSRISSLNFTIPRYVKSITLWYLLLNMANLQITNSVMVFFGQKSWRVLITTVRRLKKIFETVLFNIFFCPDLLNNTTKSIRSDSSEGIPIAKEAKSGKKRNIFLSFIKDRK